ncbi:MAG TPA: hypothetical protein VK198_09060 [Terriglobales bacterium]|nr:hypothetical protein [Terriglobales bacterium]
MDSNTAEIDTPSDKAPPPAWFRFLAPSITDLIFIVLLFAMSSGALAPRLLGDASIGWHIRNGERMLRTHSITRVDPFSVTLGGQTWYAWEWLYEAKIAGIHHWMGLNGVVFFTAVIIALTFALTLHLCLRRGADLPVAALLLALSLGVSMIHLFARPHVLSWLFTVIWFQLLDSSESANHAASQRRLWYLPALMLLWVNVHGGFVLGFALLGLYLLSAAIRYYRSRDGEESRGLVQRSKTLGMVTVASLAASLINPYGYELHVHVYRYLTSRWLMNHIDEFLSPNFHGVAQQCFVAILLITIVALAAAHNKPSLSRVLVLLLATYSGLYAARSLPVSSLMFTLIVAPLWTQALTDARENQNLSLRLRAFVSRWQEFTGRVRNVELGFRGHLWPAAAVFLGVLVCAHQGRLGATQWMHAHFDPKHVPVQATDTIVERGIREPIFAPDSWGGYLIYRLYPENRIFVDDRHDFYGVDFLRDYLKAIRLTPDWDKFLNEKHVNWALLPAGSALANMLEETTQWNVVYRDGTAVLLERKQLLAPSS